MVDKEGNLLKLVISVHEGIKYPCQLCEYKATHKHNLLSHIKSVHEDVKIPCQQCDYKAIKKGDLFRHIKTVHARQNVKYPCQQCEYKACLLYTSPSPRDRTRSRMPSSA